MPTVAEAGVPGYEVISWNGVAAPKGTPQDVIDTMNKAMQEALAEPELKARSKRSASRRIPARRRSWRTGSSPTSTNGTRSSSRPGFRRSSGLAIIAIGAAALRPRRLRFVYVDGSAPRVLTLGEVRELTYGPPYSHAMPS